MTLKRRHKFVITLACSACAIGFVAGYSCARLQTAVSTVAPTARVDASADTYAESDADTDIDTLTYADEPDGAYLSDSITGLDSADMQRYLVRMESMPDFDCVKLHTNTVGGTLGRVFNDSNYRHLAEAEAIGISPIRTSADAWHVRRPICRIQSSRYYYVDSLTHSLPYLVPEAADLLGRIGRTFTDSLQSRGGGSYRIKVTSLLRTAGTVRRLRRRNRNAVEASAHQYGTTFDISYVNFVCDSSTVNRTQEDLKNLLGEVLKQMRDSQLCYVKYERKQGCFHITARKRP